MFTTRVKRALAQHEFLLVYQQSLITTSNNPIPPFSANSFSYLEIWDSQIWESTISSPKFGTSIISTAYGAYLDHAYAQNLTKPPFMRICREFEN